jgi:hypothetical protein
MRPVKVGAAEKLFFTSVPTFLELVRAVRQSRLLYSKRQMLSMPPGPAGAENEFPYAIRRAVRIVKSFERKHDPQLSQELVQNCTAVGQPGEFDTIPIDVLWFAR